MKLIELDQRTPEWKAWRKAGITATESRVIMGSDPWKTPYRLWMEKTGRADPPDLSNVPAVRYGVMMEDHARELFEAEINDIITPCCGESDEDPIFRASFDGLTMTGVPVEIKCPQAATWHDVEARGEESDAYKCYYAQVQHQIYLRFAEFYTKNPSQ